MALIHRDLAEAELHEPKGASTLTGGAADVGKVYQSDGAGSGTWAKLGSAAIIIRTVADLTANTDAVAIGGVDSLRLRDGVYVIDADITTTKPLAFPGTGNRATITATNRSVLTYSGTASLFRDTDADGDVEIFGLTQFEAPNGTMWNITTTTGTWSFQAFGPVKFTNTVGLGSVNGGASAAGSFNLFFGTLSNFGTGLTAVNLNFLEVNTMYVFGNNSATTIFDVSGAAATGVINFLFNTFTSSALETLFDLDATTLTSIDAINMMGNHLQGALAGTVFDAGSLTPDDPVLYAVGNDALIKDSRPFGLSSLSSNVTNTTIATISTPVLVAGIWTAEDSSQMTLTTGGRMTSDSNRDFPANITARLSIAPAAGTNKNMTVYVAINGTVVANSGAPTNTDAGIPVSVVCLWQHTFAKNDYIEVFVENNTDTTDILVSAAVLRVG